MVKKISLLFFIMFCFELTSSLSVFAETSENTVSAILTAKVTTTINQSEGQGTPISNARLIVINSLGKIIATELTNSQGEAIIPVTVPKDPRFPMKNMGEVTVIAVADGYNEHINFSVPINEFNNNTGSVSIPLWQIDPKRRNEPQFLNGSYHRFTVFKMLNYYAEKFGLKRQNIKEKSIIPAPWGPLLIIDN
ncbi:hypothetical protein [Peribacillus alkalitolerans]|uniref:hypothetical protein n=1 Tax=Peribacillus alkalitolerans TaxID=1550385 RepID=UPI0013D16E2C|nr:hypothetical protein [Peribacillus alkalitolerans]